MYIEDNNYSCPGCALFTGACYWSVIVPVKAMFVIVGLPVVGSVSLVAVIDTVAMFPTTDVVMPTKFHVTDIPPYTFGITCKLSLKSPFFCFKYPLPPDTAKVA